MKSKVDLGRGWLLKAKSDLINAEYAVELRYDDEFWPAAETARQALDAALEIRRL